MKKQYSLFLIVKDVQRCSVSAVRVLLFLLFLLLQVSLIGQGRSSVNFDQGWRFFQGDSLIYRDMGFNDNKWKLVNLPHDWSIAGPFSDGYLTSQAEGGLPAGIGWYRKSFVLRKKASSDRYFIDFGGVYRRSIVWINGHELGARSSGYASFRYELTPYLLDGKKNVIAVRVDNSAQPDSRWYSGSGIYRSVTLINTGSVCFAHWGAQLSTPHIEKSKAIVKLQLKLDQPANENLEVSTYIKDANGRVLATSVSRVQKNDTLLCQSFLLKNPHLWSPRAPYLYQVCSKLKKKGIEMDAVHLNLGVRYFHFDPMKGFSLNGIPMKIQGVCLHHDLGALGAAYNESAMFRRLKLLKEMGCNAIRTSHNIPDVGFLNLCDKMGFLVMDEPFDMWVKKKSKHDYHEDFPLWHVRDIADMVLRDRNHPCVFLWSIGNEIREQFDTSGILISRELVKIVKSLDDTRPVTSALSEWNPEKNFLYRSGVLDIVGLNYHQEIYPDFPKYFPGKCFLGSENVSALETRGHYDMPSDTTYFWPENSKLKTVPDGNKDLTVSAYDQVAAYWGSTHEQTWGLIKKYPYLSGLFIWTGFDYIGEPTPYPWPARSSYFGIIDLAGFPKDVYYMYQSEWTEKNVLHVFPHWNWTKGKIVDMWAYFNHADEAELFINGKSAGIKKKAPDTFHVCWRVPFVAGTIKVVTRKKGRIVMVKELHTAGTPYRIVLSADREKIRIGGRDLCFVKVSVVDKNNIPVPIADNLIHFSVSADGVLSATDNGSETDLTSFHSSERKLFNGLALVVVGAGEKKGKIILKAHSANLLPATLSIDSF